MGPRVQWLAPSRRALGHRVRAARARPDSARRTAPGKPCQRRAHRPIADGSVNTGDAAGHNAHRADAGPRAHGQHAVAADADGVHAVAPRAVGAEAAHAIGAQAAHAIGAQAAHTVEVDDVRRRRVEISWLGWPVFDFRAGDRGRRARDERVVSE